MIILDERDQMNEHKVGFYEKHIKRLLDVIFSLVFILIFWWLYVILAIVIRVKLGSPVIFRQDRPGKGGQVFHMYKFRSMTNERDEEGNLLPDEMRLTSFGKKLRSMSLDELPEFFNLLKGDMSLVGPRPLLVQYLPLYNDRQKHRHDVKPGFTGLAQINGRNAISWEEKFEWDVEYVDRISFLLDAQIVWKTVGVLISRSEISSENAATMEEFRGSEKIL